ncbi:MAG: isoprenylcysteine carboxylmethyltransferase family protein [Pseudomonadota bacterium]
MTLSEHLIYAVLWLSFGVAHSVLASARAKSVLSALGSSYRLAYNWIAALHVAAVWLIGKTFLATNATSWSLPQVLDLVLWAGAVAGALILLLAFRAYDTGKFLGLSQYKEKTSIDAMDNEPLSVGGLNRYMRHPLYTGAILLLFCVVRDEFSLATACWATAYFIVGAAFEEKRLIARYGQDYLDYRQRVPMFIPKPW